MIDIVALTQRDSALAGRRAPPSEAPWAAVPRTPQAAAPPACAPCLCVHPSHALPPETRQFPHSDWHTAVI